MEMWVGGCMHVCVVCVGICLCVGMCMSKWMNVCVCIHVCVCVSVYSKSVYMCFTVCHLL